MTDNVVNFDSVVDVDLDVEQSNLPKRRDFYFVRKGKVEVDGVKQDVTQRIRVTDPNLVDWRILATLEDNIEILRHIIPDEDDKIFLRENPIAIELMGVLVQKIGKHFGMPEIGGRKSLPI